MRGRLARQARSRASSSSTVAGSSSGSGTTSTVQPWRATRFTDWRTLRIGRPSSEKRRGSTTASLPMWIVRSPIRSYSARWAAEAAVTTTSQPRRTASRWKSARIGAALPGGPIGSPDTTAVSRRVR